MTNKRLGYLRRQVMRLGAGAGGLLVAGCVGGGAPNGGDPNSHGSREPTFRLLVSDMPADIGDFAHVAVTFDRLRVFERDVSGGTDVDDEENATDTASAAIDDEVEEPDPEDVEDSQNASEPVGSEENEQTDGDADDDLESDPGGNGNETPEETSPEGNETADDTGDERRVQYNDGFYRIVLDPADPASTVDLTEVIGERAIPLVEVELSPGTYNKVELEVAAVDAELSDGQPAEIHVPSGRLQLTRPFEITGEEMVDFVFDIHVVRRGQSNTYNLTPVISGSGVAGEDVEVDIPGDGAGRSNRSVDRDNPENQTQTPGDAPGNRSDDDHRGESSNQTADEKPHTEGDPGRPDDRGPRDDVPATSP